MCRGCWQGDHGMPVVADDDTLAVAALIERLYALPGCDSGGPLHDVIDDMNIGGDDNGDITGAHHDPAATWHGRFDYLTDGTYDRYVTATGEQKAEIILVCEAIAHTMDVMTEGQRAAAIAWAFGWIKTALPEYAARVRTRERLACVADDVEMLLAKARALPPPGERRPPATAQTCIPIPCPPFLDTGDGREPLVSPLPHPYVESPPLATVGDDLPRVKWVETFVDVGNGRVIRAYYDADQIARASIPFTARVADIPPDPLRVTYPWTPKEE